MEEGKHLGKKILNKTMRERLEAAAAICAILTFIIGLGSGERETARNINLIEQTGIRVIENSIVDYICITGGRNVIEQAVTIVNIEGDNNVIDNDNVSGNIIGDYAHVTINNFFGDNQVQNAKANEIIKSLYLGMTKEYIKELMGVPLYELTDSGLSNLFYLIEDDTVIIRCIFSEDDGMVGYLVTVRKIVDAPDKAIEFFNPMQGNAPLRFGYSTIEHTETEGEDAEITANLGNGGEYNYYWQCYHLLYTKGFDGFIVAILPYGFYENEADMLMKLVGADDKMLSALKVQEEELQKADVDEVIANYKKKVHPNTYGIIDMNYKEDICPYIKNALYWESCVEKFMEEWHIEP